MQLIFFLEAAQDRDGVGHRRLGDKHRLEPAGKRGIFLDIFAIFIERRCPHAVKITTSQSGFEQVGRIHRTFCRPCADQRVQLVDKQHDIALIGRNLR